MSSAAAPASSLAQLLHRALPPEVEYPLIKLTLNLAADAEWRVTAGDRPTGLIKLTLDQPQGPSIRVWQLIGTDPLAMVAGKSKAHMLRRGGRVTVTGERLLFHPGSNQFELLGVHDIVPHRLSAPRPYID